MRGIQYFAWMMMVFGGLILFSCNDDSASTASGSGTVKISLRTIGGVTFSGGSDTAAVYPTITSARLVIDQIDFKSATENAGSFKFEQPFVENLMVGTTVQELGTVQIPFGSYVGSEIRIDKLNSEDGAAFSENPELQNQSILVEGYLNDNPEEVFVFSSNLSEEQGREFQPPLVLDENKPSVNLVLFVNLNDWFTDDNGNTLDPRTPENQSRIEENIKKSIEIFEDQGYEEVGHIPDTETEAYGSEQ